MMLQRASAARAVALTRANGLPALAVRPAGAARPISRLVARASEAADASAAAQEALDKAAAVAKDAASAGLEKAKATASSVKSAINQASLNVDISKLLTFNFIGQVALTGMAWATVFLTSHITMAKGASINPTTLVLLVGVALAGYSAYLSFTYLTKSKKEGLGALDGWAQLNAFYEHATFNFLGAAATIVALMANLGTLMVSKNGNLALEALCQAASNTLLAHTVSLAFLFVMTRKITQAYQK
ncbi:MAG: hypothetical protein J3K34DRAFT_430572, partial [Monoraphidium minutum]